MVKKENSNASINYFKGIDVLRFICAAGVIFHHSTMLLYNKGFATKAELHHRFSGAFFLDVFFIISGFLISLIILREYQLGTFTIKNFYARRIIRIWPLYFLVVVIKVIIIPFAQHTPWELVKLNLLYACTFTVNFQLILETVEPAYTILWSICIEEHIYLLMPIFLFIFKGRFNIIGWILTICGFISWLYFKNIPSDSGYNTAYFVSSSYFYFFGLGTLIAFFYNQGIKLEFLLNPLVQIIVLFMMFIVIFNFIPYNYSLGKSLLINGIFGSYLVWVAAQQKLIIKLSEKVSKYLGNISYGMYLIHIMIASYVIKLFKKSSLQFSELLCGWAIPIVTVIITITIATILYYFFERPILKYKKKFTTVESK